MALPHDIQTLRRRARASFYDGDHDLMSCLLEEATTAALTAGDSAVIHRMNRNGLVSWLQLNESPKQLHGLPARLDGRTEAERVHC